MSEKKRKILFLYNGGTIGQVFREEKNQRVLVPPKNDKQFREATEPIISGFSKQMDIDFELVSSKDSTNMTPNDWEKLIFRIKKAQDSEGYDAVGIAHGTDTMAYSATALSLALHGKTEGKTGLRIPVCLTGSQTPIYEPGGDGKFNLENLFRVLDCASSQGIADVMINFWDKVLLGNRALKLSEKDFEAFGSPAFPGVGVINASGVTLNESLLNNKANSLEKLELAPKFGRGVVSFELTPGLDPNVLLGFIAEGGISAMILKSLGEGNVCNEGAYNLLPVIKQASNDYMVPIFITTKFVGGNASSAHYEVGVEALKAGAIPCYDQTDVAVDVKVRWLLGNGICSTIEDFRKSMAISYAGEVTQQK